MRRAEECDAPPLADRYGFIYDVALYDVLLLLRARSCGNTAPACLTGVSLARYCLRFFIDFGCLECKGEDCGP